MVEIFNDYGNWTDNSSLGNETTADRQFTVAEIVLYSTVFGFISIFTAVSNLFVIIAVKTNKQLQTITNYFLLSLAIADATIGLISMPLFSVKMIMRHWPLGAFICDNWLAIDYTMSNASVANLMIITCDRYFSVTRPLTYRAKRTSKRVAMMITTAWIISIALWTPWIYAWPYIEGKRSVPETDCFVQFLATNGYITLSTAAAAFYLPVVIMCMLYWRVYAITKQRTHELNRLCAGKSSYGQYQHIGPRPSAPSQLTTPNGIAPRINKTCLICTKTLFCRWRVCVAHRDANGEAAASTNEKDNAHQSVNDNCGKRATQTLEYQGVEAHMRAQRTAYLLEESFLRRSAAPNPSPSNNNSNSNNNSHGPASSNSFSFPHSNSNTANASSNSNPNRHAMAIPSSESTSSHLSVASTNCQTRRKPSSHSFAHATQNQSPMQQHQVQVQVQHHLPKKQRNSESKAAKTISAILAAFIITWTPYNLFTVIEVFYPQSISGTLYYDLGYYLCYLNSSINPIVYCLTNNNFKQSFIRILKCSFGSPAQQSTQTKQSFGHSMMPATGATTGSTASATPHAHANAHAHSHPHSNSYSYSNSNSKPNLNMNSSSVRVRPLGTRRHVPSSISTASFDESRRKRVAEYLQRKSKLLLEQQQQQQQSLTPDPEVSVSHNGTIYEEDPSNSNPYTNNTPVSNLTSILSSAPYPNRAQSCSEIPFGNLVGVTNDAGVGDDAERSFRMRFLVPRRNRRSESVDEEEEEEEEADDGDGDGDDDDDDLELSEDAPEYV